MTEPAFATHQHDTPAGSGFRFLTEIIAWVTGTWVASMVHPLWGVATLIILIGLPTVFTTSGDKKHTMVETPGPFRAAIDFFQFAVAAIAPWFLVPNWMSLVCVAIVAAAVFFGRKRFIWLIQGATLGE